MNADDEDIEQAPPRPPLHLLMKPGVGEQDIAKMFHQAFKDRFVYSDSTWYERTDQNTWVKCGKKVPPSLPELMTNFLVEDLEAYIKKALKGNSKQVQDHKKLAFKKITDVKRGKNHVGPKEFLECYYNQPNFEDLLDTKPIIAHPGGMCTDLKLKIQRPLMPDDMASITTNITPPAQSNPEERRFLEQLFYGPQGWFINNENPKELTEYFLTIIGYGIFYPREIQKFVILNGLGGNGKSEFMNALEEIFGAYATTLPPTFLQSKRDCSVADPYLARTKGKKLAVCSEPPHTKKLQGDFIKSLSGGDKMTARSLNQNPMEFYITAFFVMMSNTIPKIDTMDEGILRRILLLDFMSIYCSEDKYKENVSLYGAKRVFIKNSKVIERLNTQKCLGELFFWFREKAFAVEDIHTLPMPDCVKYSSSDYITNSNPVMLFLEAADYEITKKETDVVSNQELKEDYKMYLSEKRNMGNSVQGLDDKEFKRLILMLGITDKKISTQHFVGLRKKPIEGAAQPVCDITDEPLAKKPRVEAIAPVAPKVDWDELTGLLDADDAAEDDGRSAYSLAHDGEDKEDEEDPEADNGGGDDDEQDIDFDDDNMYDDDQPSYEEIQRTAEIVLRESLNGLKTI